MNSDVQTEQFGEGFIVTEAKEVGQVGRVVLGRVDGRKFALAKHVAVNATGNIRKLGDPVGEIIFMTSRNANHATRRMLTGPWSPRKLGPNIPSY